ncbi:MAG: adenosylmethionine--8-amino-7-oxononanoate transaminase [Ignavibacteria bacterium]|nr:adenosylmethionine--8-amino-7-oxononanoate transaminase [Ignavibacteria bacterium]
MNLSERDHRFIWHPYTQMQTAALPVAIVRGEGALLFDEQGTGYIDAISSWWVNLHGHAHPYIAQKVSEQLRTLEHVMFAGFTHPGAVDLAERLLAILPPNQAKIFFSDNGSTAVEVALKMAVQYWFNQGIGKTTVIAFHNAYHGDTFGAMSASGRGAFTAPFRDFLFYVVHIDAPLKGREQESLDQLERAIKRADVAAFIFEPLVQGAGGMVMYDAPILDTLIQLCRSHGILTIADEVMTGFGRTGTYFASDRLIHKPDLICLSKGITGGTMPLGVTSCTQTIYDAFLSPDRRKTFFHGHSYTANPLACAAAVASLDLLQHQDCQANIKRIEEHHRKFILRLNDHPLVKNPRVLGTIAAFDVESKEQTSYFNSLRDSMYEYCIQHKVLIRPLGNVVYLMPPYCITDVELHKVYSTIYSMLDSLRGQTENVVLK